MLLLWVIAVGLVLLWWLYFFRLNFVAELAISFLPYIFVGLFFLGVVLLVVGLFLLIRKRQNKNLISPLFLITLSSFFLSFLYGSDFFSFYSLKYQEHLVEDSLKVYYANILYTNDHYDALKEAVEDANPDIVMLVEFSDEHAEALKEYFKRSFPYVSRNSWSTKLAGDIVFSKYPILDFMVWNPYDLGKWRYSYLRLDTREIFNKEIYLYLVHTSAPVSLYNFDMRNEQLAKVSRGFLDDQAGRSLDDPVLMIGDFNLSPWSAFYQRLESAFSGYLVNALQGRQPTYTRSLWDQNWAVSHIDHLFVSPNVEVGELEVADLLGSDHNPFIFTFSIQ